MKAHYLLILLLFAGACKTQNTTATTDENTMIEQNTKQDTACPEDGVCEVKIHKNALLQIKEDGTGALYPVLGSGDRLVVEYTYTRKGPEGTMDGDYSETIYFEIPTSTKTLNKEDASLNDVKLLYGKQCYCKGEAGFYSVDIGTLSLEKKGDIIIFDLQFHVGKTTQVISQLTQEVKM